MPTDERDYWVEVRQGWSWVFGPDYADGPWRYQSEAQELADELNARQNIESPSPDTMTQ